MPDQLTWLLDEKQEESGASDLKSAIEVVGDRYVIISRQEARSVSEQTISPHSTPTLAYGSIEFAKAVRKVFYPGRWCDWTALRCDHYYAKLGSFLLNDDYILLPASEVRRRWNLLLQQWNPIFLRPVRADKPFPGFAVGVNPAKDSESVENAEFEKEMVKRLENMEAHDLVVLSHGKVIEAEYRTVAVRGKGIVAASQYMQSGQLYIEQHAPEEVLQTAAQVEKTLGSDFPDPMYVIDIARSQGKYRMLEINGFSFASFYGCDLTAIVSAAHEEAIREWQEIQV